MKRITFLISITLMITLLFSSCSSDSSYADLLKDEKVLIKAYIKRNNINVLSDFPADSAWKENDYVLTSSGLYFHLVSRGIGTDSLETGNTVVPRYKKYALDLAADTISYWSTIDQAYTSDFIFGNSSESCSAFQEAVYYMYRNESEAKIIVTSKIGFNADLLSVTPYAYDLKIKIKK